MINPRNIVFASDINETVMPSFLIERSSSVIQSPSKFLDLGISLVRSGAIEWLLPQWKKLYFIRYMSSCYRNN